MRIFIFLLLLAITTIASAESYQGIGALDTLGDVKSRFPNANVEKLAPAWAQPDDALYKFTGQGISGSIVIRFYDDRPKWKADLELATTTEDAEIYQKLSQANEDSALTVVWVRWVPFESIPLSRLVSKYGKPSKSGFDDDYRPFKEWESKAITAFLANNEKNVISIDYNFTNDDYKQAYLKKHNVIPEFLNDKSKKKK